MALSRDETYIRGCLLVLALSIISLMITIKYFYWIESHENDKKTLDSYAREYHSIVMTALLIIMSFSVLVHKIGFGLGLNATLLKLIHGFLHSIALMLGFSSFYTVIQAFINRQIASTLYSIHVWIGFISLSAIFIHFVVAIGFYCKRESNAEKFRYFRSCHRNIGLNIFATVCLSAILGISVKRIQFMVNFEEKYTLDAFLTNVLAMIIVVYCLTILYFLSTHQKLKSKIEDIKAETIDERKRYIRKLADSKIKR